MKKIILHLCADIGSDSRFYDISDDYEVIRIGEEIGVENNAPVTYDEACDGIEKT